MNDLKARILKGLVICYTLAALSGCGGAQGGAEEKAVAEARAAPIVVAAEVRPSASDGMITSTGTIVYERETTLSFKTGGVIAELRVDEGDIVKRGQRLARLDLTELAAGVTQAEAAVLNAETQYERVAALVAKGHLAQARLDDAALARDQTRANRDAVLFNRDQGVMSSNAAGVVLRRFADPGQTVAPGAPVLQIGDAGSGLVLRVPVSAEEAARVRVGDPAELTIDGLQEAPRAGEVVRIAAKSDAATGNFEVDLSAGDGDLLRSGLVGTAKINTTAGQAGINSGVMRIPALALLDARADQGYVYVIDDKNIAHRRAIATNGVKDGSVLVVSGLASGDRIVAEGAAYVRDGEAVTFAAPR